MQIPPVTGAETNIDAHRRPAQQQRLGYGFWRCLRPGWTWPFNTSTGAPLTVDSSMAATAAMILDQATAGRVDEAELISRAEEAATVAAT